MVAIWRIQHPDQKEYSFCSHVHQSYTRSDYFIVEAGSVSNVSNTHYHNILISDHSPVILQLQSSFSKPKYKWRFNPLLQSSPGFKEYRTRNLREVLEIKDNGKVSDSGKHSKLPWEDLLFLLRPQRRKQNLRLQEVEKEIIHMEQIYKTSLLQSDYIKILKLKSEYNSVLGGKLVCYWRRDRNILN